MTGLTDTSKEAQAARVRAMNNNRCPTCGARPGIWCGAPGGLSYNPKRTVHAARLDGTSVKDTGAK